MKFKKTTDSAIALDWLHVNDKFKNDELNSDFLNLLSIRSAANNKLEALRKEGVIGKSVEAKLIINSDKAKGELLFKYKNELPMIFNVSSVELKQSLDSDYSIEAFQADGSKCPRCWKHATDIGKHKKHLTICLSCAEAVEESK